MNIRRPLSVISILGIVLFVVLIGGKMVYDLGRYQAGFDVASSDLEIKELQQEIGRLQKQLADSREGNTRLESAKKVDSYANTVVRDTLEKMQQETLELKEELQFYRSIVSPTRGQPGVNIHNFKINQGEQERQYHYNLTLIHIQGQQKHHRRASGVVNLTIEGEQVGVQKTLTLSQVAKPKSKKMKFSFKYFRRFEGSMILPRGFTPKNVVVNVVPSTRKVDGDNKTIEWPTLLE